MSEKLFYRDPLVAAYMAREFGVEFLAGYQDDELGYVYRQELRRLEDVLSIGYDRSFVSYPGNPDIFLVNHIFNGVFEPQEGDQNILGYEYDGKTEQWIKRVVSIHGVETVYYADTDELDIDMRDGKHFFMPEVVNE